MSEVVPIRERESIEEHRLDYPRPWDHESHRSPRLLKIWSTIQEAPSTASAARELGLNLSRVHKIEDMLTASTSMGLSRLGEDSREVAINTEREAQGVRAALDVKWDHKRDPLLMDLRVMFADFVRDPLYR